MLISTKTPVTQATEEKKNKDWKGLQAQGKQRNRHNAMAYHNALHIISYCTKDNQRQPKRNVIQNILYEKIEKKIKLKKLK